MHEKVKNDARENTDQFGRSLYRLLETNLSDQNLFSLQEVGSSCIKSVHSVNRYLILVYSFSWKCVLSVTNVYKCIENDFWLFSVISAVRSVLRSSRCICYMNVQAIEVSIWEVFALGPHFRSCCCYFINTRDIKLSILIKFSEPLWSSSQSFWLLTQRFWGSIPGATRFSE
jgi:hypothetical protein